MGLPNVMNTGRTGMVAAKAAISTAGHNIANANTEGFSRQRVKQEAEIARHGLGHNLIGQGTRLNRVDRINDEYIEKQVRNSNKDLMHLEEKEMALRQTEDIFNEMNGDGLNRMMSKFFNEFRKLANEPENESLRESVRESSRAMVNDFRRVRKEVDDVRRHIDSKIEGYVAEMNMLADQVRDLNQRIKQVEIAGASANDLQDKRDLALKALASYIDISTHKDKDGAVIVDVKGVGPLVGGASAEKFSVARSPKDSQGKPENALDLKTSGSATGTVTHQIKGGRIGALLEVRDQTLGTILDRLDDTAFSMSEAVNSIHRQGFTRNGLQGVDFFRNLAQRERAAEYMDLSDQVKDNVAYIAAGAQPDAPADNRVAIAISRLQDVRMMNQGGATIDDFYNSIVSDVGVASGKTRSALNQQRDIVTQLGKIRDQISGVSIDEETANLLQFQHAFDASAKVIAVADECLKTVLDMKR